MTISNILRRLPLLLLAGLMLPALGWGQTGRTILRYDSIHHPVAGSAGMVVSQRQVASEVGTDILAAGGNAVDAAIAVGFALAVVLPRAGNIGGGGFMLVHLAESDRTIAIDYRERAPRAAHRDMFLDASGAVNGRLARFSHRSAGVPGTVAGLLHALARYGTMDVATIMAPAIRLAEEGFKVGHDLASAMGSRRGMLTRNPTTRGIYLKTNGEGYVAGERLKLPILAKTLRVIARDGRAGFYGGAVADAIVDDMRANDGLITHQDLLDYEPTERAALRGNYRGFDIVTMPPPSSGGIHLVQMLNILEHFPLAELGANTAASLHVMTEAMKFAFADRSKHLGDMDFYDVPIDWLTGKQYAADLAAKIDTTKALSSDEIAPGVAPLAESQDTTHYSVIDRFGNAVANTYTLNFSFGSGITVPGAGFLLNNEMDDFSAKPGVPNAFGLLGGAANSIEPGKRPLSSMTPTMVFRNGQPFLITGSPGGSRIISTVLQHVVNMVDHRANVAEALSWPRIHHQWYPDRLEYELGLNADTLGLLQGLGHNLHQTRTIGSIQAISVDEGRVFGAADPRRPGAGAVAE